MSVVVVVSTSTRYLGDAVASVMAQSAPPQEIVLVDAGPADGPGSLVAGLGLPGLRHVRHTGPEGAALWARALDESTGELTVLLDGDDLLPPDALRDLANSSAAVAVGDVLVLDDDLRPSDEAFWGPKSAVAHLADGDWLPTAAFALRRSAIERVGPIRSEVGTGWFAEWLARAAATVELAPVGRHTVMRRAGGTVVPDDRALLTVLRTLARGVGPDVVVGAADDATGAVELGLRLLRLGDASGALDAFRLADRTADTGEAGHLVAAVEEALASGELRVVEPWPLADVPTPAVDVRTEAPRITIAIPTHQRAHLLGDALDSAIGQTRPADEILVIDDGSTDGTDQLLDRYRAVGVRTLHQGNQGGPLTRNRCVREATGDFVLWVDSDDVIAPDTIERHLARLLDAPDADVVYGDLDVVDHQLRPIRHQGYQDWYGDRAGLVAALFNGNCIPNPSTMIRRSVLLDSGGYDPLFRRAHDYEMFSRLAADADFAHNGATVLRYRMHDGDALSGTMEGKDLRYELTVVHRMLARHDLPTLVPSAGWGSMPDHEAEAAALSHVTVRLVQLGDLEHALEHARLAVAAAPSEPGRQLVASLEQALASGVPSQGPLASGPGTPALSGSPS